MIYQLGTDGGTACVLLLDGSGAADGTDREVFGYLSRAAGAVAPVASTRHLAGGQRIAAAASTLEYVVLVPKLATTLRDYTRQQFVFDLTAGVIVGIVALPLAIAFAIASGVTPQAGLYTAIVAGFIISALGGSRVQIGGPTGAFVVIVYGIVLRHGVDGLTIATIMAGFIVLGLGLARMGSVIKFIPISVTIGFTSGIAVIIFSSQVKDLLGLRMGAVPSEFFEKWGSFADHIGTANPYAIGVAALTLAILILWPKVSRKLPAPFVALVVTTAIVQIFQLPVETIGSRFGAIDVGLPRPHLPSASWSTITALVGPAFAIALLGSVESLLSAVVADGMISGRHRSNMELVAQGIANIASPIFGGIPATGAIARTATNVRSGGRTPVAGIVHALTLLLITIFFGKWAALIPLATLGGILTIVAYSMSEWRNFLSELRAPRSDVAVLLTTFLLTVVVDLTVAIEVGMVLAAFLFMKRMAEETIVSAVPRASEDSLVEPKLNELTLLVLPTGVEVFEIQGPFFFGAAETFKETIRQIRGTPKVLIIRMREVPAMDSTGIHAMKEVLRRTKKEGGLLVLCEVRSQPLSALRRSGLMDELGDANVVESLEDALERARRHLAGTPEHAAEEARAAS
jgi:SulP family sulfate permease